MTVTKDYKPKDITIEFLSKYLAIAQGMAARGQCIKTSDEWCDFLIKTYNELENPK